MCLLPQLSHLRYDARLREKEVEHQLKKENDNTDAMKYVRSLKDAVKRRFAVAYLDWIILGRSGAMPSRGQLSPVLARAVCINLDALS